MRSAFYILCVCVAFAISCNDHSLAISPETQFLMDLEKIDTHLAEKGITAQQHESGLRYVINQQGTGDYAGPDKCIRVSYALWLLGDEETDPIESSAGIAIPLVNTILGWRIGLKELQKGGSMTLYVPSKLAYGPAGSRNATTTIPPNSCLVFRLELINLAHYNSAAQYCETWQ